VASDITLGGAVERQSPDSAQTFAEFHHDHAASLGTALGLVINNSDVASDALAHGLSKTAQRWRSISGSESPAAYAFGQGVAKIDRAERKTRSGLIEEATGGYVRGLSFVDALGTLPTTQRSALVASYHLGWSDAFAAAGLDVSAEAVTTRRDRATAFLADHAGRDADEVASAIRAHFEQKAASTPVAVPTLRGTLWSARLRTFARGAVAVGAGLAVIAAGAALIGTRGTNRPTAPEPEIAEPPSTSSQWFGPVTTDSGGFVALNTSGAADFISSTDGVLWLRDVTWNSRAVNLRTEITSLSRTGSRYVAVIETAPGISGSVPPYIATSVDLSQWQVRQIELGPLDQIEGLRDQVDVINVAAAGSRVLVAVAVSRELDYRSLGIGASDVCIDATLAIERLVYLCDGTTLEISRTFGEPSVVPPRVRFYLGENGADFTEIRVPEGFDPLGFVGVGDRFEAIDSLTGDVMGSEDGRAWTTSFASQTPNRFTLLEGSGDNGLVVILPSDTGWTSVLLDGGEPEAGSLPTNLDPASIWSKPILASGPAGWALLVSTSRPGEQRTNELGWAVDDGDWIVSKQPDSGTITARSADGTQTYRYSGSGDSVQTDPDGSVRLRVPAAEDVLIEISALQIEQSRAAGLDDDASINARVFFSEDGVTWRVIWESVQDTRSGTVAVGERHVVLGGARLTGPPISIPLDE